MPKFNLEGQVESKQNDLPLASKFFAQRPDLKEHYFAVNEFKYSKNEEWLICTALNAFTILISTKSSQHERLMWLIQGCQKSGTAVICVFSKESKSSVVFGEDEETPVNWEDSPNFDYRYNFKKVNQYSSLPPLPNPPGEGDKPVGRRRAARPQ